MWLPVFLASFPPPPPCLDNGMGGTTGRGSWPPLPLDSNNVTCGDLLSVWNGWRLCHASAVSGQDSFAELEPSALIPSITTALTLTEEQAHHGGHRRRRL